MNGNLVCKLTGDVGDEVNNRKMAEPLVSGAQADDDTELCRRLQKSGGCKTLECTPVHAS